MKTVVIDTNIVLNGLFNPQSFSRMVLERGKLGQLDIWIPSAVIEEATCTLDDRLEQLSAEGEGHLEDRLLAALRSFVASPFITQKSRLSSREVRAHLDDQPSYYYDRQVAATAMEFEADFLCTTDLPDFQDVELGVVELKKPNELTGNQLHSVLRGNFARPREGTLYLELEPLWAGGKYTADRTFELLDASPLGKLQFHTKGHLVEFGGGALPSVECEIHPEEEKPTPWQIAVAYHADKGIALQLDSDGGRKTIDENWEVDYEIHRGLGFDADKSNGAILHLMTSFPFCLSHSACNNLMRGDVLKSPGERISLDDLLELMSRKGAF